MTFKNKTAQKFISLLLIISVLSPAGFILLSVPQKAEAQYAAVVIDPAHIGAHLIQFGKDFLKSVVKLFLEKLARTLLDKMTQSTVNWINSGFHGKPLFLEQPGSFVKDIVKDELKGVINQVGYDSYKFPYGKDFALNLISQAKNKFEQNASYSVATLSNSIYQLNTATQEDLQIQANKQRKNFSEGGYNQFIMDSQLPQNNFIGFSLVTAEEVARRSVGTLAPVTKVKEAITQGSGFLSPKECKSNLQWNPDKIKEGPEGEAEYVGTYNPPDAGPLCPDILGPDQEYRQDTACYERIKNEYDKTWNTGLKKLQTDFTNKYGCKEEATNTTPGHAIANQITKSLTSKQNQGELAAALGNALALLFDALINKFMQMGLNKLAKIVNPPPRPTIDDFNYYGEIESPTSTPYYGAPPTSFTRLTVTLSVVNSTTGATLSQTYASIFVDGNPVTSGTGTTVTPGIHTVSATSTGNYTVTITGDCASDGSVDLAQDESKICNVAVATDAQVANTQNFGRLTVTKVVINDDNGTLDANTVPLFVNGISKDSGIEYTYPIGSYTVSETNQSGYSATFSGDCDSSGVVDLGINDVRSCTITNNDGATTAQLTVTKIVINNDTGTATVSDVPLFVDGVPKTSGVQYSYNTGTHTVTETSPLGYSAIFSGDCAANGSVTLALGETKSCIITNDDIPGFGLAKLTVTELVVNDNGGTLNANTVPLFVDGVSKLNGVEYDYSTGTHRVTQSIPFGYAPTFSGDCDATGNVSLALNDRKFCTITNNDISPKLTVIKYVINNDSGTLLPEDVPLYVNGLSVISGAEYLYDVGTYTVSENNPVGYTATFQGFCTPTGSITLGVGDVKTCVIVNDDI